MIVPHKPQKKKDLSFTVSIIEEKEKFYAKINYFDHNTVDINCALLQIPKQELSKFFKSKRKIFCIKATIWKWEKKTKYALPNSDIIY